MKSIYKYKLTTKTFQLLSIPAGSKILSVQGQQTNAVCWDICVWVLINKNEEKLIEHKILVLPTGSLIPTDINVDRYKFLNTVQLFGGRLIFHVFIKDEK